MKFIKQFFIIICFSFAGEILHYFIPLAIPASIYGMVLLFIALLLKVLRLEAIKETAKYLISIMQIMFIPTSVGIINNWNVIKPIIIPVIVIIFASTVLTMGVSGKVAQIIKTGGKKK